MKLSWILIAGLFIVSSCSNSMTKLLKNPDQAYKLRMAEQYYVKKKYAQAQQIYEDIMPYYKTSKEFEDIYYKYAYTAYYQRDYVNAEDVWGLAPFIFKHRLELAPGSDTADTVLKDCVSEPLDRLARATMKR